MRNLSAGLALAAISMSANALTYFEGKVTLLQPTYMPNAVSFKMDAGNATCPAGQWLLFATADSTVDRVTNNKVVYATLLAALSAGKTIRFYMNDGDTGCTGTYMHILN